MACPLLSRYRAKSACSSDTLSGDDTKKPALVKLCRGCRKKVVVAERPPLVLDEATCLRVSVTRTLKSSQHLDEVVPGGKGERVVVAVSVGRVVDYAAQTLLHPLPAVMRCDV
jgi:hypothetical protein